MGEELANRLRKRAQHLSRWASREGVTAYRVYDRDIPGYHFAIDRYADWVVVHEYPWKVGDLRHEARRRELLELLPSVLGVAAEHTVVKLHARHRWGESQYLKEGESRKVVVSEGSLRFEVDLGPTLDSGLFLDHRRTRAMVRDLAAGRRCLNLFSYTGSFTVYAAAGGAAATTSIDLSRSYLDWTRRNLDLNGLGEGRHALVRADALAWLSGEAGRYDLIVLDPPSHSGSKRMAGSFDVQRDHPRLLERTLALLGAGGTLFFSTNLQTFSLAAGAFAGLRALELTPGSLPEDFRGKRPHRCWRVDRPG